jgi:hypothetical protein
MDEIRETVGRVVSRGERYTEYWWTQDFETLCPGARVYQLGGGMVRVRMVGGVEVEWPWPEITPYEALQEAERNGWLAGEEGSNKPILLSHETTRKPT